MPSTLPGRSTPIVCGCRSQRPRRTSVLLIGQALGQREDQQERRRRGGVGQRVRRVEHRDVVGRAGGEVDLVDAGPCPADDRQALGAAGEGRGLHPRPEDDDRLATAATCAGVISSE